METLTRKERKERTREGLLETAEKLFSEKGIAATTTADVAQALEVSHGTVFLHFPKREDLVLAVISRFSNRLFLELDREIAEGMPLDDMLRAHLRVLASCEDFYARLISEAPFLPPGGRELVTNLDSVLSQRIYRAAQKRMREGSVKTIPSAPFFTTWMALVHYLVMNRDLLAPKTPILGALDGQIIKHFHALIQTDRGN